MSKSTTLQQEWLDHYFLNTAISNVGDASGLPAAATVGSLYVNLYSTAPDDDGGGVLVTYTGYTEFVATRDGNASTGWLRTTNQMSNRGEVAFGKRTDAGAAVNAVAVGVSRSSGATNPDYWSPLSTELSKPFVVDDTVLANALIAPAHGFLNDETVSVLDVEGATLPTATVQGTTYYVVNKTDDYFYVAATLGGAAIDLANGSGRVAKVVNQSITQNITPQIAAGALVFVED